MDVDETDGKADPAVPPVRAKRRPMAMTTALGLTPPTTRTNHRASPAPSAHVTDEPKQTLPLRASPNVRDALGEKGLLKALPARRSS
jgi:hypothetical protein